MLHMLYIALGRQHFSLKQASINGLRGPKGVDKYSIHPYATFDPNSVRKRREQLTDKS